MPPLWASFAVQHLANRGRLQSLLGGDSPAGKNFRRAHGGLAERVC